MLIEEGGYFVDCDSSNEGILMITIHATSFLLIVIQARGKSADCDSRNNGILPIIIHASRLFC